MANNINYGPSTITSRVYDIILLSGNWIGASAPYTYSVNVMMNINSSDTVFILPDYNITNTQNTALLNAIIIDGGISSNVITLKALGTKPTVNIPVRLVISDSGYIKSIYEINGLINASTNEFGVIKLATNSEIIEGTNNTKAVTPLTLHSNYLKLTGGTLTGQLNGTTITANSFVGNASTATKLVTARNITLTGGVTGTASFDGSANVSLTTIVANNSHTHTGDNITSKVGMSDTTNAIAGISVYTGTTNPTSSTRVNVNGYLYATRMYNAVYNDYAECFDTAIHYNDCRNRIVEIKNGKTYLASAESDKIIGVVSDTYGFILYGSEESIEEGLKVPVGMAGTLMIDSENEVSIDNINKFVISGVEGKARVIEKFDIVNYFGCIVGKVIDIDEEKNQYKVIISLK